MQLVIPREDMLQCLRGLQLPLVVERLDSKLDNPSSPGNARSCRQMPVVTGKKTNQTRQSR